MSTEETTMSTEETTMSTEEAKMRLSETAIEPVTKVREVPLSPEAAFGLFINRLGTWWPLATHSIGGDQARSVTVDGRVGGRVVEVTGDGQSHSWADIIAWDPPHRFVMTWHPTPDPEAATVVEVRFEAMDSGCRLHLEHRGWEELGEEPGTAARDQYNPGWDAVLSYYMNGAG